MATGFSGFLLKDEDWEQWEDEDSVDYRDTDDAEPLYVYPLPKGLDTTCPVCFTALYKDPHINMICGHHFCGSCSGKLAECPECRCTLRVSPDKGLQRALKSLLVYCSKKDDGNDGCRWEGELGELLRHQRDTCMYFKIECSNCSYTGLRKQVLKHEKEECCFRTLACEYCNLQYIWQELNDTHYDECPQFPLTCDDCNEAVLRQDMRNHITYHCPKAQVVCEASEYGCDWTGLREEEEQHLKADWVGHFNLCTQNCCEKLKEIISDEVESAHQAIDRLDTEVKLLQNQNDEMSKEIVSLNQTVFNLEESISDRISHHVSELEIEMEEKMEKRLKELEIQMRTEFNATQFAYSNDDDDDDDDNDDDDDDIVFFKPSDDEEEALHKEEDYVGGNYYLTKEKRHDSQNEEEVVKQKPTFTYRLKNFRKWKAKKETCYSQPFYTSDNGYKMRLRVHPNGYGDGEGNHLSVYVCLLEGKFDKHIAWPFYGEVTIELQSNRYNMRPCKNIIHYTRNVLEVFSRVTENHNGRMMSRANGCPKFLSHSKVDQYLQDDTLVFHIFVKRRGR